MAFQNDQVSLGRYIYLSQFGCARLDVIMLFLCQINVMSETSCIADPRQNDKKLSHEAVGRYMRKTGKNWPVGKEQGTTGRQRN